MEFPQDATKTYIYMKPPTVPSDFVIPTYQNSWIGSITFAN